MRGPLRTVLIATATVLAAVAVFVGATLPPAAVTLPATRPSRHLYGAYHVHTDRSDGAGSVDEVAAAAARAGLQFVILTDHGDGTRPPLPPGYRHGVLVIDAVELSTFGGHVIALNLVEPAPFPLAGEARDVVDDIHRLGGWAVVAHPDSPNPELRWRDAAAPYDGLEWLNVDSEWRDEAPAYLVAQALRTLVRAPESIARLLDRPDRSLRRWDQRMARPAFGLAALDAHARIGWDEEEPRGSRTVLEWPTYEQMFRTIAQVVILEAPAAGDPARDAADLLAAIRAGHSYSIVRAFAGPAELDFTAVQDDISVPVGGQIPGPGAAVFRARVVDVPDARLRLLRNGVVVAERQGRVELEDVVGERAVYRVEVAWPGRDFPWVVSNPIYAGIAAEPLGPHVPAARPERRELSAEGPWRVEHDPSSTATAAVEGDEIVLRASLGGGAPAGQFAAAAHDVDGDAGYQDVSFEARADRPMRIRLQVRLPGRQGGQRWGRSLYLDETLRRFVVRLEDLRPIGSTSSQRPVVARIESLLFVIDTLNTLPGTEATIRLSGVSLGVGDVDGGQGP